MAGSCGEGTGESLVRLLEGLDLRLNIESLKKKSIQFIGSIHVPLSQLAAGLVASDGSYAPPHLPDVILLKTLSSFLL